MSKKVAHLATLCLALMMLSGCFAQTNIRLATLESDEAMLLGEIMAQQLESAGLRVSRGTTFASMEELAEGMTNSSFELGVVFVQDTLTNLNIVGDELIFDPQLASEIIDDTFRDVYGFTALFPWNIDASYSLFTPHNETNVVQLLTRPNLNLTAEASFFEGTGGLRHIEELFELNLTNLYYVEAADALTLDGGNIDILALRGTTASPFNQVGAGFMLWPENYALPIVDESTLEIVPEVNLLLSQISFLHTNQQNFIDELHDVRQGLATIEEAAASFLSNQSGGLMRW